MSGVPARVCEHCGEYLPHACAPLVTVEDYVGRDWLRGRLVTITDRPEGTTVTGNRRVYG